MSTPETSRWERRTFPELIRLANEVPEAGIHLQSECWQLFQVSIVADTIPKRLLSTETQKIST